MHGGEEVSQREVDQGGQGTLWLQHLVRCTGSHPTSHGLTVFLPTLH